MAEIMKRQGKLDVNATLKAAADKARAKKAEAEKKVKAAEAPKPPAATPPPSGLRLPSGQTLTPEDMDRLRKEILGGGRKAAEPKAAKPPKEPKAPKPVVVLPPKIDETAKRRFSPQCIANTFPGGVAKIPAGERVTVVYDGDVHVDVPTTGTRNGYHLRFNPLAEADSGPVEIHASFVFRSIDDLKAAVTWATELVSTPYSGELKPGKETANGHTGTAVAAFGADLRGFSEESGGLVTPLKTGYALGFVWDGWRSDADGGPVEADEGVVLTEFPDLKAYNDCTTRADLYDPRCVTDPFTQQYALMRAATELARYSLGFMDREMISHKDDEEAPKVEEKKPAAKPAVPPPASTGTVIPAEVPHPQNLVDKLKNATTVMPSGAEAVGGAKGGTPKIETAPKKPVVVAKKTDAKSDSKKTVVAKTKAA